MDRFKNNLETVVYTPASNMCFKNKLYSSFVYVINEDDNKGKQLQRKLLLIEIQKYLKHNFTSQGIND